MKGLPAAALSAATVLSVLALTDAVINALAPTTAPWDPTHGTELIARSVGLLHGAVYLLLASVLTVYRYQINGKSKSVPWLRRILAACYLLLAISSTWTALFAPRLNADPPGWVSLTLFAAFLGSFLTAIPFGVLLLRQHRMQLSGWLLASPILIIPLTMVLEATTRWAHPAYLETVVNLGTALLGVTAASKAGTGSTKSSSPANASPFPGAPSDLSDGRPPRTL